MVGVRGVWWVFGRGKAESSGASPKRPPHAVEEGNPIACCDGGRFRERLGEGGANVVREGAVGTEFFRGERISP